MAQNPSLTDRENPWPGLASFTEDTRGFFFGRAKETDELSRLVRRETLTVLFGQSGLGKSSLLQAGLFPILREHDHLPLYLRLDHDPNSPALAEQVKTALHAAFAAEHVDAPPPGATESLWEYFHRKDVDIWSAKNRLLTPVLAFDQFEELFTLGRANDAARERSRAFLTELADLVENRPPAALQEKFERNEADPTRFNYDKPSCRVILSLREDFLPDLEGLKREMPALIHNRLRLKRLNGVQALEAVTRPAPDLLAEGVGEKIVEFVSGARGGSAERLAEVDVEPPLLSVICRELNERRRALGQEKITADLVSGNRREILHDFYERSVGDLPEGVRTFIEDHLLTKSGFRDNLALETALEFPGVTRPLIDVLVARRLLRVEDRLGVQRVELTHDVLADVIRAARDARQQRLAIAAAARAQRRQRWIIVGLASAVAALLVGAFFGTRAQRRAAQQASQIDFNYGSQLLAASRTSAGLAHLVRAATADRHNYAAGSRLISALAYRSLALPIGHPLRHAKAAAPICVSPDGKRVVTVSSDEALRVWNVDTGELAVPPMVHSAYINGTAVNGDVTRAVTTSEGQVFLWDLTTGQKLAGPLPHPQVTFSVRFSRDGRWFATGSIDGTAKIWDAATGELKSTVAHVAGGWISALDFSPDSGALLTTAFRREWRVWSVPAGQPLTPMATDVQTQANFGRFSPDGQLVVICDFAGAQLWDWKARRKVGRQIPETSRTDYAEFSNDGTLLVTAALSNASVAEVPSGKVRHTFDMPRPRPVTRLADTRTFSADGKRIVLGSSDGFVRLFDTTSGLPLIEPIRVGGRNMTHLAPGGDEIWTGGGDGWVRRWSANPSAAKPLAFAKPADVLTVRLSDDRTKVLVLAKDRREWRNTATGELLEPPLRFPERVRTVTGGPPETSSGDRFIGVVTEKDAVEVWDLKSEPVRRFNVGATSTVATFSFSPDRQIVAVSFGGGNVALWNTETGQRIAGPLRPADVAGRVVSLTAISPDKSVFGIGFADGSVALWDFATGKFKDLARHRSQISSVVFTIDGRRVATADVTGVVIISDVATGKPVTEPLELPERASQVLFSRDGRSLLIGQGAATSAYLWDAVTGRMRTEPLASSKSIAGASFDREERRVATAAEDGIRLWDARTGRLLVEPLWHPTISGAPWISHDDRLVLTNNIRSNTYYVFALPVAPETEAVPNWLLRLGTIMAGGIINRAGSFEDVAPTAHALEDLANELASLPDDAPYAKWGRWFLANPASRSISPEIPLTAEAARKLAEPPAVPAAPMAASSAP